MTISNIWEVLKSALGAGETSGPQKQRTTGTSASATASFPYRACTIEPGRDACAAVQCLQEQRFLQVDVPQLPLPECGRLQCDCRYRRHEDRRHRDDDRRFPGAAATEIYAHATEERRRARGRRADD
ncbi:hypothetical protein Q6D67_13590 [Haliea sp. E1-2-M8]|uniref:hypothetical protein n=1 Tax=Haliea sp. E1-2-M8 TaxID=3064706 RepID=UPI0027212D50|nr:hypothetical protein [Haliea sp. E1-2-M8]MDO8862738.1 hypothetical protein [Haliea sp. E1-2-M8]